MYALKMIQDLKFSLVQEQSLLPPPSKICKKDLAITLFGQHTVEACEESGINSASDCLAERIDREMHKYLAEPGISIETCPLSWWRCNEKHYPLLSKVAKKYWGAPASSVPCERIFSSAGLIISNKRASLSTGTAEMLVYLHANWKWH